MEHPAVEVIRSQPVPYYLAIIGATLLVNHVVEPGSQYAVISMLIGLFAILLPWLNARNAVYLGTATVVPSVAILVQNNAVAGLLLMLALALWGWKTPLAFAMPMMLLGLGHGFLVPPTLASSVGLVPALAGSAAAVAGLMQQLMGAVGGFTVGWVSHDDAVNLSCLMLEIGRAHV